MDTTGENPKMPPQLPQFPNDDLQPLKVGQKVEIMRRRKSSGFGDSWFPATVCKVVDGQNYGVILGGEEGPGKMLKTYWVSWDKIRPDDVVEHFSPETKLEPRAAVEAFCAGAWSKGEVVCRVDNSDRYLVKIGSKKRRATSQPEIKEFKELRPLSHKKQYMLGRQSGKGPCSHNEMTSRNDHASHDPEPWSVNKSHRALQQPLDIPECSEHELVLCETDGAPISVFCQPLEPGHSTPTDDEAIQTATDDEERDTYPTDVFQRKSNDSDNVGVQLDENISSELTRKVSGWTNHGYSSRKVVTHFKRLRKKAGSKKTCNQHCSMDATVGQEECMALDTEASFEERNIIHSNINANLEDAQSCQNRIAEAKSEYAEYLNKKDIVEAQVLEKSTSLSQMHSLLDENDKAIAELEQKLGHLRQKGQKIEKDMEHKESELKRLKETLSSIYKACYDYKQLFSRIMYQLKHMHSA